MIKKIIFEIGDFFDSCEKYEIANNKLHYTYHDIDKTVDIKDDLFDNIENIIEPWKSNYYQDACDGIQWELDIVYADGKKKNYTGSNAYPENYDDLVEVLKSYVKTK